MTRMNPAIKTRWAAALRSGVYVQGQGYLNDPSNREHCCLGVLCEIAAADGVVTKKVVDSNDGGRVTRYIGATHQDGSTERLPKAVQLWAGLPSHDPSITWTDKDEYEHLSEITDLNDTFVMDFAELADLIEEKL